MNIQLHYIERGHGEPLILLHGNGESSDYFAHQLDYFSAYRRVFAIDTRGHGKSPRGDAPFTIRQFAEDLKRFMDEHSIDTADILGFSDGGNIAMVFALKYPERIRRLILNGANLNPGGVKLHVQLPIEIGYRISAIFSRKRPAAKKNMEMLGLMVHDPDIPPEALSAIRQPTLVIVGSSDMIKINHTRLIVKNLPDAQLVILSGGHFIANENPAAFNHAVDEFLKKASYHF